MCRRHMQSALIRSPVSWNFAPAGYFSVESHDVARTSFWIMLYNVLDTLTSITRLKHQLTPLSAIGKYYKLLVALPLPLTGTSLDKWTIERCQTRYWLQTYVHKASHRLPSYAKSFMVCRSIRNPTIVALLPVGIRIQIEGISPPPRP